MLEKACVRCGCTWKQFVRSGLFGCPHCYEQFMTELVPTLKRIQKTTYHKGSSPKINGEDKQLFAEYSRLMAEKELAGLSGEFSRMAEISLELNALIEELKSRGIL